MDSDLVKSQFSLLESIKTSDEKLFRLNKELDQVPADRNSLEQSLESKKKEFLVHKTEFEKLEKELRRLESDLKEREDRIRKAEGKLMDVKTNEEYKAANVEVENQKKEKSDFEDKIIGLISKSDAEKSQLSEVEKVFKDLEKVATDQLAQLKVDEEKIHSTISQVTIERDKNSTQLEADVRRKYDAIRSDIPVGVACVEKGLCLGCRVLLRPQLYNAVIAFREVSTCPNCHRVLIPLPKTNDEKNNPIL